MGCVPWYRKTPKTKEREIMSDYTNDQLNKIWEKGLVVDGLDPAVYRTDVAEAMMKRDCYGEEGNLGWEVDHIFPRKKLEELKIPEVMHDNMLNLRPMNSKNNAKKGDDYPEYKSAFAYNENVRMNVEKECSCEVDAKIQATLAALFGLE